MQIVVPGGKHFRVPWGFVAGVLLAATVGLVVAVLMLTVFSRPSEADLRARAFAGDREASAELSKLHMERGAAILEAKEKANEIEAKKRASKLGRLLREANFTPGTYTKANPKATDGAKRVASFYLLVFDGKIAEARALLQNPTAPK